MVDEFNHSYDKTPILTSLKNKWIRSTPKDILYRVAVASLLLTCVILIGVLWKTNTDLSAAISSAHTGSGLCADIGCMETATRAMEYRNTSVDPCEDFYEYACGNYMTARPFKMNGGYQDVQGDMLLDNKNRLINLIEQPISQMHDYASERKLKHFFQACNDMFSRDQKKGLPILNEVLPALGGWKVIGTWQGNNWDLNSVLKKVQSDFSVEAFYSVSVETDRNKQPTRLIHLRPSGTSRWMHREWYTDPSTDQICQDYKKFIRRVGSLLARDAVDMKVVPSSIQSLDTLLDEFVNDTFTVESKLAQLNLVSSYSLDVYVESNKPTLSQLTRETNNTIDWTQQMTYMFNNTTVTGSTKVVLTHREYFKNLTDMIDSLPDLDRNRMLHNYMIWRVLETYSRLCGLGFVSSPHCDLTNSQQYGKRVVSSPHCELTTSQQYGIRVVSSPHCELTTSQQYGIRVVSSPHCELTTSQQYGIRVVSSPHCELTTSQQYGIRVVSLSFSHHWLTMSFNSEPNYQELSWDYIHANKELTVDLYKRQSFSGLNSICFDSTQHFMGEAVGSLYINRHFSKQNKYTVQKITDTIRHALEKQLDRTPWMDRQTKQYARDKLDLLLVKIGYPEWMDNSDLIDELYNGLNVNESDHFKNVITGNKYQRKLKNEQLDKTTGRREEWNLPVYETHFINNLGMNTIDAPAGILQFPVYSSRQPHSATFGSFGSRLGFHFYSAVDEYGQNYDKNGDFDQSWWTNQSLAAYRLVENCVYDANSQIKKTHMSPVEVEQIFHHYMVSVISWINGVRLALIGYKDWMKSLGTTEKLIPGLGLTNEQVLFLAHAQLFCYDKSDSWYNFLLQLGLPTRDVFVNFVSGQLPEFSDAFHCKPAANEELSYLDVYLYSVLIIILMFYLKCKMALNIVQ
ncbi:hypothetical protein Btru_004111 [Bulinus truncatus]|nr:hypothetical protein Btru_004111 [Bulinus truncatus]